MYMRVRVFVPVCARRGNFLAHYLIYDYWLLSSVLQQGLYYFRLHVNLVLIY